MSYPGRGEGHPWADFLHHRARALRWMRDEMLKGPEEIAQAFSMDPMQVTLILMTVDAHPENYGPLLLASEPPLHGVVFEREGRFIARCLEVDFFGEGDSGDEALRRIRQTIAVHLEADAEAGRAPLADVRIHEGRTADHLR